MTAAQVTIRLSADGSAALYMLRSSPDYAKFLGAVKRYAKLRQDRVGYWCPVSTLPRLVRVIRNLGLTIQWSDGALEAVAEYEAEIGRYYYVRGDTSRLFPYQRRGAAWLSSRTTGLLADEMGLGKTAQTLAAASNRLLIVCPGVAKGVWEKEIRTWRPDLKPTVLQGRDSFVWPYPNEAIITNYDILPEDAEHLRLHTRGVPRCIDLIFDEAHALKNPTAKRTILARGLSEAVRIAHGRVWLLTATPMLNHGGELWEVLEAAGLANEAFGSREEYCHQMGAYQTSIGKKKVRAWGVPSHLAKESLARVSLRRMRKEVLPELPGKTHQDIPVSLAKADLRAVEALLRDLEKVGWSVDRIVAYLDKGNRPDGWVPFSLLTRLRNVLSMAKMGAMVGLVEEYEAASEPLIVFSAHRPPIDLLEKRDGWRTITGDVSNRARADRVEAFQNGMLFGLAGTIKAMGVSVTLTHAAHTLFVDHEWTPAINQQAEDRTNRIGQTRACIVRHLVADHPVDIRVSEVLRRKTEAIGRIL